MKNLVLIGMPGSGKSAVGRVLARQLGLPLTDTDQLVEERQGRSIPDIFARDGEAAFRDMETEAVRAAAALGGAVIATGGGVVLRPENMEILARTGVIFFRDRAVEDIVEENHAGRPLIGSDRQKVYELYTQRIGLYRKYAQYTISHTKTVEEAAARIAALYEKERGR